MRTYANNPVLVEVRQRSPSGCRWATMSATPHASIAALLYAWLTAADDALFCVFVPVFALHFTLMLSIVRESKYKPELRDDLGSPQNDLSLANPLTIGMLFRRQVDDAQVATLLRRTRTAFIAVPGPSFGLIVLSLGRSAVPPARPAWRRSPASGRRPSRPTLKRRERRPSDRRWCSSPRRRPRPSCLRASTGRRP
jgi:hypothetical protein